MGLGGASGHATQETHLIMAQQQTDDAPSTDKPAAGDDAATPATPEGGSDDGATAPAESDGGSATPPTDNATAPAADPGAATAPDAAGSESAPAKTDDNAGDETKAAPSDNGSPDVAPIKPEASPADAEPAAPASSTGEASSIDASQLKIGTAVFGSDGAKIGEINGVKSDTSGKVQEILVTAGGAAGLNAKVFAVSGDKIASVSDGVKLSLSSDEAKKLPIIDNSNG